MSFENSYMPVSKQLDVDAAFQRKLQYNFVQNQLEINKNQIMLDQRQNFESQMQEVRLRYKTFLDMLSYTIYEDNEGKIICAITDPTNEKITARPILNVIRYQSVIYYSYQPVLHYVMNISWEGGINGHVCFNNAKDGISPQVFLKSLKMRGVLFLVSGRTEKKVAEALLAYSYQNAKIIELPFFRGWNFMGNGRWQFADQNALILMEVEQNAVG